MMATAWQELIKRYANGRQICNCGDAYYSNTGIATISDDDEPGGFKEVHDYPVCEGGCSAAQISAREYVAKQVLKELEGRGKE